MKGCLFTWRVTHTPWTEYERVCPVGERWALPVRGTMVFSTKNRAVRRPPRSADRDTGSRGRARGGGRTGAGPEIQFDDASMLLMNMEIPICQTARLVHTIIPVQSRHRAPAPIAFFFARHPGGESIPNSVQPMPAVERGRRRHLLSLTSMNRQAMLTVNAAHSNDAASYVPASKPLKSGTRSTLHTRTSAHALEHSC